MEFTENAIKVIKAHEPCHLVAYRKRTGSWAVWAIGYSHTNGVLSSDVLDSEEEADALLREDCTKVIKSINKLLKNGRFTFKPNQNQVDALVSFAQNQGLANLNRLVEGRTAKNIATALLNYNRINGVIDPSLTSRRMDEQTLFMAYPGVDKVNIADVEPRIITVQDNETPIVNDVEDNKDIDMMIKRTENADGTTTEDVVPFDRHNQ